MRKSVVVAGLILACGIAAAELPEKWTKRIELADANYLAVVQKADDARSFAIRKAALERIRVLKSALTDATKSGDFLAVTELQNQIDKAEASGKARSKPKDTIKMGGHEYAIVDDQLSYHMAKERCEEMGGHLVAFDTPQEQAAILAYCRQLRLGVWIGATNEVDHKKWMWVTGREVVEDGSWRHDNFDSTTHGMGMTYWPPTNCFNDDNLGARMGFVCEWDK